MTSPFDAYLPARLRTQGSGVFRRSTDPLDAYLPTRLRQQGPSLPPPEPEKPAWEYLKDFGQGVLNVTGAGAGAVAGGVAKAFGSDAYSRALQESAEAVGTPADPGIIDSLRAAPGAGRVIAEALAPGTPQTAAGRITKNVGGLVGDIATDPVNYALGGLKGAMTLGKFAATGARDVAALAPAVGRVGAGIDSAARAVNRASQIGRGRAALEGAAALGGSATAAGVYAPEIIQGTYQGAKSAGQAYLEGDYEKAIEEGTQAAMTGLLGGAALHGIRSEGRSLRSQPAAESRADPLDAEAATVDGAKVQQQPAFDEEFAAQPAPGRVDWTPEQEASYRAQFDRGQQPAPVADQDFGDLTGVPVPTAMEIAPSMALGQPVTRVEGEVMPDQPGLYPPGLEAAPVGADAREVRLLAERLPQLEERELRGRLRFYEQRRLPAAAAAIEGEIARRSGGQRLLPPGPDAETPTPDVGIQQADPVRMADDVDIDEGSPSPDEERALRALGWPTQDIYEMQPWERDNMVEHGIRPEQGQESVLGEVAQTVSRLAGRDVDPATKSTAGGASNELFPIGNGQYARIGRQPGRAQDAIPFPWAVPVVARGETPDGRQIAIVPETKHWVEVADRATFGLDREALLERVAADGYELRDSRPNNFRYLPDGRLVVTDLDDLRALPDRSSYEDIPPDTQRLQALARESVPSAIEALSRKAGQQRADLIRGPSGEVIGRTGNQAHPAKVEYGLTGLKESPSQIAAALKRDKGNPLELKALDAMAEHIDRMEQERGAPFDQRVEDRRQEDVPVHADQRVVGRRQKIAKELELPEDHVAVERVLRAEDTSVTDPITGLKNRRGWDEALKTIDQERDHVVAIDLRGFKPINDRYGHRAGDDALASVGSLLQRHFGDESARPGGDEFAAIARNTDPEDAARRVEAFRADLARLTVPVQMPDGTVVDIPGFQAHIGVGRDAETADLASNAARDLVGSGRAAQPEGPAPRDSGPVEGTTGRPGEGRPDPDPQLGEPRYSPGQRGLFGAQDDVAPPAAKKPEPPKQTGLFGQGALLQGVEARTTEGREAEGALFTQEQRARERADAARQQSLPAEPAARRPQVAQPTVRERGVDVGRAKKATRYYLPGWEEYDVDVVPQHGQPPRMSGVEVLVNGQTVYVGTPRVTDEMAALNTALNILNSKGKSAVRAAIGDGTQEKRAREKADAGRQTRLPQTEGRHGYDRYGADAGEAGAYPILKAKQELRAARAGLNISEPGGREAIDRLEGMQRVLHGRERDLTAAEAAGLRSAIEQADAAKQTKFAAKEKAPAFYSALARAAEQKIGNGKHDSAQILKMLQNTQGVKPDEIKWTGLDDFLAARPRASRQEILDHLRENAVEVREVVKGGLSSKESAELDALVRRHNEGDDLSDAEIARWDELRAQNGQEAKYGDRTLPGGENYRELLLTLPAKRAWVNGQPVTPEDLSTPHGRAAADRVASYTDDTFRSSHYDEPNILSHVRFNERVDSEGKRTLFVEEIQSDWAQKGRREGFKDGSPLTAEEKELQNLNAEYWARPNSPISPRLRELREGPVGESLLRKTGTDKPPAAPFVDSTEKWTGLAARRILRYAAENGFDRVAWTTGEQQAARYDLSKHIDSMQWDLVPVRNKPGEPKAAPGAKVVKVVAMKNDGELFNRPLSLDSALDETIGKEHADRIRASVEAGETGGEFSGLDLKVGGSGMKGFYDKILPGVFDKLGKKWGARVGQTEVRVDSTPRSLRHFVDWAQEHGDRRHRPDLAEAWSRGEDDPMVRRFMADQKGERVHSLDVTDSMRRSVVEEGQPLFRAAGRTEAPAVAMPAIQRAFPSGKVSEAPDGFLVDLPGGRQIRVLPNAEIEVNVGKLKADHPEAFDESGALREDMGVVGSWQRIDRGGIIRLAKAGDEGTLNHETFHAAMDLALSPKEKAAVLKHFGNEEAASDAYAAWKPSEKNSFFQKIADFFRRIYNSFKPSWESAFGEVRSGTVFERTGEATGADTRFATAAKAVGDRVENFKRWFGESKVVDERGAPLRVYHGTQRPDRVGNRFRGERATSGPMAFFTDDPAIASKYGEGKADTSLEAPEDYAGWFKYTPKGGRTPVDIDRAWYHLSPEERQVVAEKLPHVTYEHADTAEGPFVLGKPDQYGLSGKDHWGYEIGQARGNVLKAAKEIWLNGGTLVGDEEAFMTILRHGGLDMSKVKFDDPFASSPAVIPTFLSIKNPLEASKITPEQIAQLERAAARTRKPTQRYGADAWDKNTRSPSGWIEALKGDSPQMAWTSIPDWVTRELKRLGFDGIKDEGGKLGGAGHNVWIPFEPTQIKSAIGNRGTFDPTNPDIRYATAPKAAPEVPQARGPLRPIPPTPEQKATYAAGKAEGGRTTGKPPDEFVNLDRASSDEDIRKLVSRVADAREKEQGQARSYRSWEEARENAVQAGITEADFKRMVKEGAVSDHVIEAGRMLRTDAFKDVQAKLKALGEASAAGKDTGDLEAAYESAINKAAGVMWSTTRAGAEAGRALAIHRKLAEGMTDQERLYRKIAKGRPGLSEGFARRVLATNPADSQALAALIRGEFVPSKRSMAYELWINGLLSGPPTHLANILGNSLSQAARIAEKAVAGGIDAARVSMFGGSRERFVGEAFADMHGIREGLKKGAAAMRASWADELSLFKDDGKVEHAPKIPGPAGSVIRTPTRALTAMDEFFKAVASTREAGSLAYRKARKEGLQGAALQSRMATILGDLEAHPEILRGMKLEAEYQTYTKKLGTFGQMAMGARDADPSGALKVTVPFFRTPLNIAKYTLERTPLNFIRIAAMAKKGTLEGGALSEELAKATTGTVIGIGLAMMANEGLITGGGPSDPRENELKRKTGWQPYSLHVGDQYISFQRLEPFSSIAGFAADLIETKDEKTQGDLVNKIVGSVAENLTNKTFLQGLENAFLMWNDPRRYASQWAKSLEGSMVPAIFGRAAQAIDPTLRETSAADGSAILARIPGASKLLPERRTSTGEPARREGTAFERFASPLPRTKEKGPEADLEREFLDADFHPSRPARAITVPGSGGRKVELSGEEYSIFVEADRQVTDRLRQVVRDPVFKRMDPIRKKSYLRGQYQKAQERAAKKLLSIPSYRAKVAQARKASA